MQPLMRWQQSVVLVMVGGALFATLFATVLSGGEELTLLGGVGARPALKPLAMASKSAGRASPLLRGARFVPRASTRYASTYRRPDGSMLTRVSSSPVNFRDAHGRWRAIDSTLVARGSAFVNRAGPYRLQLPLRLADGVQVASGPDRLSMRLLGADGAGVVRGARARYPGVLPGVSAIYDSQASRVREQLVLSGQQAPARLRFALTATAGLWPRLTRGGDVVFSRAGRTVFVLPASFAYPSGAHEQTHMVRSALHRTAAGWTLTVAANAGWVHQALAHGPVVIDPTVELTSTLDCRVESASFANSNYCADTGLEVGSEPGSVDRSLVKFDVSSLPTDAYVIDADFGMQDTGPPSSQLISIHRVTRPFTSSVTWNRYNSSSLWTSAGGDFDATASATAAVPTPSGWVDWHPTKLVQSWVNGSAPNYGLLAKADDESLGEDTRFNSSEGSNPAAAPDLHITWTIDTTPPSAPTGFEQSLFYPADADHTVTVSWAESTDPVGTDGSLASGVVGYEARYGLNGGAFTAWQATDGPNQDIAGVAAGTTIAIQARAVDGAGNKSTAGSAALTVVAQNEDPVVNEMAAQYYASAYGTDLATARAWMTVEGRADQIDDAAILAGSSGSGYGGAWFDNVNRKFVINLTSGTSTAGAQAAIDNAGVTSDARIATVGYTQAQLDNAYPGIVSQLAGPMAAQVIELSRDTPNDRLNIDVGTEATAAQRAQIAQVAASAPVAVNVANSTSPNFSIDYYSSCKVRQTPFADYPIPTCDDPLRGGTYLEGAPGPNQRSKFDCTAGFNVRSRSTGASYLMTTGHCFDGFPNDNSFWAALFSDEDRFVAIGPNHNPYVYGNDGDAGLITVDPNSEWVFPAAPRPWVFIQPSKTGSTRRDEHYRIRSVNFTKPGITICTSGARTGGHCGEVTKTDVGGANRHFGKVNMCKTNADGDLPDHGDSGAPMVRLGSARGMLVGAGDNPCDIYFQSAKLAENLLNVNILLTSSG